LALGSGGRSSKGSAPERSRSAADFDRVSDWPCVEDGVDELCADVPWFAPVVVGDAGAEELWPWDKAMRATTGNKRYQYMGLNSDPWM
jgi:hypothetical protein